MSNLNHLLLNRLKAKHDKLSKRFLKGVEGGNFQTLSKRRRHTVVERLKRLEKQIGSVSQKAGLRFSISFKHWAVALALGAVVSVANGQEKKPDYKSFKQRLGDIKNSTKNGVTNREENATITLTEVARLGSAYPETVFTGDFDNDGDNDALYIPLIGGPFLLTNNGGFTFTQGAPIVDDVIYGSSIGDFDGDGDLDIIYKLFPTEETYALLNDGSGSFTKTPATLPNLCFGRKVGDIDGDGDDDILINNNYCDIDYPNGPFDSFGFKVLVNNSLNFVESSEYIIGGDGQSRFIGFADVDGDGDLDIPVVHRTLATNAPYAPGVTSFEVFVNDGSGNFTDGGINVDPGLTTSFPIALTGDLDNDTDIDLIWSNGSNTAAIINDGSGIFTAQAPVATSNLPNSEDNILIDIDGDGFADILNEGFSNDSTLLLSGDGAGGFTLENKFLGESFPVDLDNDGDQDLITINGNLEANELEPGFFISSRNDELVVISQTYDIDIVDIDDDGDLDIIQAGELNTSRVWLNDGTGENFNIGQRLDSAATVHVFADLDNDGDQDLVRANDFDSYQFPNKPGVDILSNNTGTLTLQSSLNVGKMKDLDVADFDGDGDLDICVLRSNFMAAYIKVFSNEGALTFTQIDSVGLVANENNINIDVGDIDGDNDIDVVMNYDNQGIVTFSNNGSGDLSMGTPFIPASTPYQISDVDLADLDGDGDLDLFASNSNEYAIASFVFINDGGGTFTDNGQDVATGEYVYLSALADVDGDGDTDIITGGYITNPKLWINDGAANFIQDGSVPILADEYAQPAFGDLDGDGDIDMAYGGFYNPNLVFLLDSDGGADPLLADSLALVEFYNATNGDNWTNNQGWLQDGVELGDWFGVTTNAEDVTALNLPDNNLDGAIPPEFVNLTGLVTADLSGNLINDIQGDFTVITSITSFDLSDNDLSFEDFEQLGNLSEITIGEQTTDDIALTERIPAGDPVTFDFQVGGANNEYQWFKNGTLLEDSTRNEIIIDAISRENQGDYFCEATSTTPGLEGLTLTSEIKSVTGIATVSGTLNVADMEVASDGLVRLLTITESDGFDSLYVAEITPTDNGSYLIEDVTLADYLVVGIADTLAHPDVLPTYFTNTVFWDEADTLFLEGNATVDITSVFSTNPTGGIGRFSGILEEELPDGGRIDARGRVRRAGVSMRRGRRLSRDEGSGELVYYVFTNENGEFLIPDIEPGEYNIDIQYPGFPMDEESFLDITIGTDPKEREVAVEAVVDNGVITVTQLVILGLNEPENGLVLYPNPTKDWLKISDVENRENLTVEIYNLNGARIEQLRFTANGEINVIDLSAGQYVVKVLSANGQELITRKILVEKR